MSNELLEKSIAANTTATAGFASSTGGTGLHVASENGNGGLRSEEHTSELQSH